MIRVTTSARLHFGLFVPEPEPAPWLTSSGKALPVRRFGGVGLMVRDPALVLRAEPATTWSATGPLADRALRLARQIGETLDHAGPPLTLTVEQAMPAHAGLGSGTQLGLAVAKVISLAWNRPATLLDLARWSGRGLRSGIGLHGFAQGGFLIDAGKTSPDALPLLLARHDFPQEWSILLIRPKMHDRMHGEPERDAFARLPATSDVAGLSRLVLFGMLPALLERDLPTFGESLYEFNRKAGEAFASVQGGPYASRELAGLIAELRTMGLPGVGQSSWGPTLFVVAETERVEWHRERLTARGLEVRVTKGTSHGTFVG